jgi:ubiquinone/menaquinone biosynthesis C-methylase UbiE
MNRFHRWYCRSDRWRRTLAGALAPWVLGDADLGDDVLEIGAGPGLVTDVLRTRAARVTAVDIDGALVAALAARLAGTNVDVVHADATALPFPDASFSAAVCCTMLHHVPSTTMQDRLLGEVRRVLRPRGLFVGSDSTTSLLFRLAHLGDTLVPVAPPAFATRLAAAGFRDVAVEEGDRAFRFRARRA